MSPSSTKVASGGSFHTFQGIIPKKQPAASSNARPRVAGTRRITTPHACTECKRRKIRCDGKLPCGQCITSRAPKNCSYDKHRQRMIPSRKALDSLAQSLEECRSVLRRLYPNHDVSALRSLDKQELINLLAQSQCCLSDPLPSPPLESSFPKSSTPMMGSDSLLELQTSLEADLDSLIGELEFEVPAEQREANDETNYLTQQSWWDFGSRQWSSVSSVPPMMETQSYGHDMMTPGQHSMLRMEHALTCNNLKCRRELSDRALVTTCSHIFCVECSQRLGITGQEAERRNTCPACESQLTKPDDAVITNLNPSEDYKTSVLSGLSPNVIMECAGRALSFWAYQTTQNICYQQHLYRTLTDKYSSLGIRLEKTVNDANTEIEGLHHKMSSLMAEQESLRRKHEEVSQAFKEKSRKVLQLQELYDKVKRRAELGQIQRAASDAVDHTLQAAQLDPGYSGHMTAQNNVKGNSAPAFRQSHRVDVSGINSGAARNYHNMTTEGNQWSRLGGSSHRDISGVPVGGLRRPGVGGSTLHQGTGLPTLTGTSMTGFGRSRQSPNNFTPSFINHRGGLAGVGLTSGIKVSQASNTPAMDVPMGHL
ncbi:e3 ubiquitin- ligase ccnb1ip1 [Fusarium longipes]|uniref:E3 ubiquitin-ligase ccnb1ip1 n=1 Tax=Fusarium longipes TaxID=694270 RepID=A0A395S2S0_9HYPO|nr:e3 ubiquitin- ligase ccnb1ip1 [Fusarium longipes]